MPANTNLRNEPEDIGLKTGKSFLGRQKRNT